MLLEWQDLEWQDLCLLGPAAVDWRASGPARMCLFFLMRFTGKPSSGQAVSRFPRRRAYRSAGWGHDRGTLWPPV